MQLTDVTLREGDQMPGREYSVEQKFAAGKALDELGVKFLQVGFPTTGEKDTKAIRRLAGETESDVIGLARALPRDVEAALEAEADIVEIIIPLSDDQLRYVLGKSREDAFEMTRAAVDRALDGGATVHVSLIDAFRTDLDHITSFIDRFDDVDVLNLADTVGVRTPESVRSYLTTLESTINLERVGVHFHDDLGVATANVLVAHDMGVGKADVSVTSLGERAGNPALEEVVVAGVVERGDDFGIDAERLIPTCESVLFELDETVEPRKAVLGQEVTEHESGLHTAAMLREPRVFEPFDPATFGGERRLLFGGGTGRSGARTLLERAGFEPTDGRVEELLGALAEEGPLETDEAVSLTESLFET